MLEWHSEALEHVDITQKYFSWGDIIGKNKNGSGSYDFSEENYYNGVCGSGYTLHRDIPQGNATYDAATVNMGSPWKMPTSDQVKELINNTNHTWTTVNLWNGRKFTSKTDSTKFIFFPAPGILDRNGILDNNKTGCYWSTHSIPDDTAAHTLYFNSYNIYYNMSEQVFCGIPVRAII